MDIKRITACLVTTVLTLAAAVSLSGSGRYAVPSNAESTAFGIGDVNGDSGVDAKDASELLVEYTRLSTGAPSAFSEQVRSAADVNSDGVTDAKDASLILAYYSYVSTGGSDSPESYFSPSPATTTTTTLTTTTTAPATTTTVTTTAPIPAYVEYHFRSKSLLEQHFSKHGAEFADDFGYTTPGEYEHGASNVINSTAALYKTEKEDGDGVYYIVSTNEFVVLSTDGFIRTYFRPSSGKAYFDRQ
ncbi:MAG: hypothetical protein IKP42_07945 [Ruminococcus sp.]|nr:hypothetical protein [Ruminococcus sp.]